MAPASATRPAGNRQPTAFNIGAVANGTSAAAATPSNVPSHSRAPNVWAQFAASLLQGIMAAMQPTTMALVASSEGVSAAYEEGGRYYDKYQLVVLRGFSHMHLLSEIQQIWASFQTTSMPTRTNQTLSEKWLHGQMRNDPLLKSTGIFTSQIPR